MGHKTEWREVQHLTWVCNGCSAQCETTGCKPPDGTICDGSDLRAKILRSKYDHPELLGGA